VSASRIIAFAALLASIAVPAQSADPLRITTLHSDEYGRCKGESYPLYALKISNVRHQNPDVAAEMMKIARGAAAAGKGGEVVDAPSPWQGAGLILAHDITDLPELVAYLRQLPVQYRTDRAFLYTTPYGTLAAVPVSNTSEFIGRGCGG
jgi:hypothetical protein